MKILIVGPTLDVFEFWIKNQNLKISKPNLDLGPRFGSEGLEIPGIQKKSRGPNPFFRLPVPFGPFSRFSVYPFRLARFCVYPFRLARFPVCPFTRFNVYPCRLARFPVFPFARSVWSVFPFARFSVFSVNFAFIRFSV